MLVPFFWSGSDLTIGLRNENDEMDGVCDDVGEPVGDGLWREV